MAVAGLLIDLPREYYRIELICDTARRTAPWIGIPPAIDVDQFLHTGLQFGEFI